MNTKKVAYIFFFIFSLNSLAKNIYLIIDSSGSMAAMDAKNRPKMKSAKKAMTNLIKKVPDDTKMELISYGNTKRADCSDINTLFPFGVVDKKSIIASIKSLSALGNTPIEATLKKTLSKIKSKDPVSLILITDGLESCGGDPCAFIKELKKKKNITFKVDVIGFDIKRGKESLTCIAENSGGEYFDAKDSDDLLNKTEEMITNELKDKGRLKIVVKEQKVIVEYVIKNEKGETIKEGHNFGAIELLPGKYNLEIRNDLTSEEQDIGAIEIMPNELLTKEVSFSRATKVTFDYDKKRFHAPSLKNKKTKKSYSPYNTKQRKMNEERNTILIPNGTYSIRATAKKRNGFSFEQEAIEINGPTTIAVGTEGFGTITINSRKGKGSLYLRGEKYKARIYYRDSSFSFKAPADTYIYKGLDRKKVSITVTQGSSFQIEGK